MGISCAFIRQSDQNIEALIRQPSLVYSLLELPVESPRPTGGFFARLFGRTPPSPSPAATVTLPDSREEGFEYAWANFEGLRSLLEEASRRKQGLLVYHL